MGFLLNAIGKQHLFTIVTATYAAANVALNLVLIPKYSFIGAGIATLISEIFLFILTFIFVSRHFHAFNVLKILYKPLIAVAIMAAAVVFLKINMFAIIAIGAAVYFAVLFLLKAFDEGDYLLLKKLLKGGQPG